MRWAGCQSDRSKDNEEHQTCQVVTLGCGIIHHRVWGYRRDRSTEYARGATDGAPEARQIADRFHILPNLREAVERAVVATSYIRS
jgi:hypothetical protein